jgi:glyoxylase-like metal-dependent hydrolase (beta-lactamase superfamily II)
MLARRVEQEPCDHSVTARRSLIARVPKLRDELLTQAVPTDYFERFTAVGTQIDRIGDSPVWAFRRGFSRSLLIDTPEGLAVFDTFDNEHAHALRNWMRRQFPGKAVRWLIYSHYHLDHTRGGALLDPVEVIAHEKCSGYLADLGYPSTVANITTPIQGDTKLRFGQVEVDAYDLGLSHTDTLFAFHLPEQRVLFTADVGFVRMLPPFGFPDWYYPGYMRALDRTAALDFDQFIPSHGELGLKRDLVDYADMLRDVRDSVGTALERRGGHAGDGRLLREILREVYPGFRDRYGDWAGFDGMMFPLFGRLVGGAYLGF